MGRCILNPQNKTEWRAWAKAIRSSLPDLSERVCKQLEGWLTLTSQPPLPQRVGGRVLAYRAFSDEVRLEPLIDAMPFITWLTTRINPGKHLSLHAFSSATVRNRFGILEPPAEEPELDPGAVDMALVPGLVFDARGVRLGYGAGFYDRLLPTLRQDILIIGVTCDALIVPELPSEAHDVRMTHLVTESGVRQIDRASGTDDGKFGHD